MSPDPITTAASAAAIGAVAAAVGGSPPDPVVIASLAGSLCSAWARPSSGPEWTWRYIGGSLVHTILSFGAGMSSSVLAPVFAVELVSVAGWAIAFPAAAFAHQIIPSVGEVKTALLERIRGRASTPPGSDAGGQP
jgi:hypothetical protein